MALRLFAALDVATGKVIRELYRLRPQELLCEKGSGRRGYVGESLI